VAVQTAFEIIREKLNRKFERKRKNYNDDDEQPPCKKLYTMNRLTLGVRR